MLFLFLVVSPTVWCLQLGAMRPVRQPLRMVIETPAYEKSRVIPLPAHPNLRCGKLKNGLEYAILKNASPRGRFEAHLEVFAGSADEEEKEQGVAHLVEHVVYMGSRKRERLFGTGSQTNAYTDFHHTVFYACCPVEVPGGIVDGSLTALLGGGNRKNDQMLPRALDALCEVLNAQFAPARVEKERAAVLSEMSMVNTIDYRVECQILRALHAENALSRRFPIGLEEQIRAWNVDDVKDFHAKHYRPDNALLYIVGDIDPKEVESHITKIFNVLPKSKSIKSHDSLKAQSRHFPPVLHTWSGGDFDGQPYVPGLGTKENEKYLLPLAVPSTYYTPTNTPVRAHVFQHELLQSFSFHLFAKRPIEAMTTLQDHRLHVCRRLALAALQVRLNVMARNEPLFSFVEFNYLDSPREACAVCSLDMTADAGRWEDAVTAALAETRRLGEYGITQSELERFGAALVTDSEQLAAMGDQLAHSDQITHLMEAIACGHTWMSPETAHAATVAAIDGITLDEVNAVARDLCDHVLAFGRQPLPSAMVACAPSSLPDGTHVEIDSERLLKVAERASSLDILPEPDMTVPTTLLTEAEVDELKVKASSIQKDTVEIEPDEAKRVGAVAKKLGNGARIVVKPLSHEAQRGAIRITAAGGRSLENKDGMPPGSIALGCRTLQEGGAFEPWTREQVELFCVDRLIMVEVVCDNEAIHIDFQFPTPAPRNGGCTGLEAALQIAHKILQPGAFVWETDALNRGRVVLSQQHETTMRSMEGAALEMLTARIADNDFRFLSCSASMTDALTLDNIKKAMTTTFTPSNVEVVVVGDFVGTTPSQAVALAELYIGSVESYAPQDTVVSDTTPAESVPVIARPKDAEELKRLHVEDSDPRAVAHIIGPAPNRAGFLADGTALVDAVVGNVLKQNNGNSKVSVNVPARWRHPVFASAALALLQEVINRRLFSVVRERRQLTYDANFQLSENERLLGGWFLVTVTASPANADAALQACKDTLAALRSQHPPSRDNLDSARRVVVNRHLAELTSNKYWCDQLTGTTFDSMPSKKFSSIADFAAIAEQVTVNDLTAILNFLDNDSVFTCVATSGSSESALNSENTESALDAHACSHVSLRRR